jgi:hypothetical protein
MRMKWNTLFEFKESTVTYEETMVDVKEYQKLLEPPKKPEKAPYNIQNERMCSFHHKLRQMKEHCH